MPLCIFIRGLPGSGKSTLSNQLKDKYGFIIFDPELIIKDEIFNDFKKELPADTRIEHLIYRFILKSASKQLHKGTNIIWCQPWRKIINIKITTDKLICKVKDIKILVIELELDSNTSWDRAKGKFLTCKSTFDEFIKKYQKYNLNYDYFVLSGSENIDKIFQQAQKLITPYLIK